MLQSILPFLTLSFTTLSYCFHFVCTSLLSNALSAHTEPRRTNKAVYAQLI